MLIVNPIYDTVFKYLMEELAEIELENTFGVMKRQLQQRDKELEQKDKALEENKKNIEAKDQVIEEKEKLIQDLLSQLKNK